LTRDTAPAEATLPPTADELPVPRVTRARPCGVRVSAAGPHRRDEERRIAVANDDEPLISQTAVAEVVDSAWRQLGACYDRALTRGSGLSPRVTLKIVIMPDGRVHAARVVSRVEDRELGKCVAGTVSRLRFPASAHRQPMSVVLPVVLDRQSE
jgi:TonB family protein